MVSKKNNPFTKSLLFPKIFNLYTILFFIRQDYLYLSTWLQFQQSDLKICPPDFTTTASKRFGVDSTRRWQRSMLLSISLQLLTSSFLRSSLFSHFFLDILILIIPQTFSIGQISAVLGAWELCSSRKRKVSETACEAVIWRAVSYRGLIPKKSPIFVSDLCMEYEGNPNNINSNM